MNPLLDDYKKNLGRVIYFEDFTDYMLLQRQSQHNERLAALGEFSAGIAHEIKNPLTIIRGFTDLLKDKKKDPDFIQKYLTLVPKEVERMNKIVENLLDFAKPSKQEHIKVDIHGVLTNIKEIMDYDMKKKYIEMELDLEADGMITGEQGPLTQVFLNIILNSIQAINEKGNIWIKTKNIYENNKDFLYIIIEDSGSGIPPKIMENIFNPFFTTKEKGTGLGLAIAFRIVQKHGGNIEVKNRKEGGARFELRLPR
jgi:signal transduction histidine kinase